MADDDLMTWGSLIDRSLSVSRFWIAYYIYNAMKLFKVTNLHKVFIVYLSQQSLVSAVTLNHRFRSVAVKSCPHLFTVP